MAKIYNKIVESTTEPSKEDLWLKEGKIKKFKNGWEDISGNTDVKVPTKVSELENDSGFVERENYTSGNYQISKSTVLYENENEEEVITKTKGMNSVSLRINPLAELGTSSKEGIQLIFKDLSGNEFLRFPNEDGWIEDEVELGECIISDTIGNNIVMVGGSKSYYFTDTLPSEFKLYVQSRSGGERYFNLTCDVNGSMSIDTKFNQKQDTLKSGINIKTIGGQSILGGGNINLGTAAYKDVEDLQVSSVPKLRDTVSDNYSDFGAAIYNGEVSKFLAEIESYGQDIEIYLQSSGTGQYVHVTTLAGSSTEKTIFYLELEILMPGMGRLKVLNNNFSDNVVRSWSNDLMLIEIRNGNNVKISRYY